MSHIRTLLAAALSLSLAGIAVPAAAVTTNDTYDGRTVIAQADLPLSISQDLTSYTNDSTDDELSAAANYCDVGQNTAWFEFTTTTGGLLSLEKWIDGGSWAATSVIATGVPGDWQVVRGCTGYLYAPVLLQPGTYSILIGSPIGGGQLTMNLSLQLPPANDTLEGAVSLNDGPFSIGADLKAATNDPSIGCRDTARSGLWFTWTAPTSGDVRVDAQVGAYGSSYMGDIEVATGSPGNWAIQRCDSGKFAAVAGTQYTILVGAPWWIDQERLESLNVRILDVYVHVKMTINPWVSLRSDGAAVVRGSYTCSASGTTVFPLINVDLSQRQSNGRDLKAWGQYYDPENEAICNGTAQPWLVEVNLGGQLPFKPGAATAGVGWAFGGDYGEAASSQTIKVNLKTTK